MVLTPWCIAHTDLRSSRACCSLILNTAPMWTRSNASASLGDIPSPADTDRIPRAQSDHTNLINTLRSRAVTHSFEAPAPSFRNTSSLHHIYIPQGRAACFPRLRRFSLGGQHLATTYTLLALLHIFLGTCPPKPKKSLRTRATTHHRSSHIVKLICHQPLVLLRE